MEKDKSENISRPEKQRPSRLKEGRDYYINEQGLLVLTEHYHLKRGRCCKNGCLHCPYGKL